MHGTGSIMQLLHARLIYLHSLQSDQSCWSKSLALGDQCWTADWCARMTWSCAGVSLKCQCSWCAQNYTCNRFCIWEVHLADRIHALIIKPLMFILYVCQDSCQMIKIQLCFYDLVITATLFFIDWTSSLNACIISVCMISLSIIRTGIKKALLNQYELSYTLPFIHDGNSLIDSGGIMRDVITCTLMFHTYAPLRCTPWILNN